MNDELPTQESEQEPDHLLEVLTTLEGQIRRQNSLKFTFLKGTIYGVGTVVGASVLVALFGGVIAATVNEFTSEPVLNESLETRAE